MEGENCKHRLPCGHCGLFNVTCEWYCRKLAAENAQRKSNANFTTAEYGYMPDARPPGRSGERGEESAVPSVGWRDSERVMCKE